MSYKYYQVIEHQPVRRIIYTFNNEAAAHDMVEFIIRNDFIIPDISVEEYDANPNKSKEI